MVENSRIYTKNIPEAGIIYEERLPVGYKNFSEKMERMKRGEFFEWPNMVALNQVISCFIKKAKKIAVVGSGTGTFEWFASVDSSLNFISSEFDNDCVEWCKKNRQRENIVYTSKSIKELMRENGKFDLAVCVDVIEHVGDFGNFLVELSQLSNRAIITTPNKDRNHEAALSPVPEYYQHVREWDAGELYWVLRVFYRKVDLYAMPDLYVPQAEKIGLMSTMTPLIAICEK